MMNFSEDNGGVAVVGGGIAGLTAAAYLARAGRAVTLYEQAGEIGGRARTADHEGYRFNFGPHALYRGGVGVPILRELGVTWSGNKAPTAGYGLIEGRCKVLPTGLFSFAGTKLLPAGAKAEFLGLLTKLMRLDPVALRGISVRDWLEREVRHEELRALLAMLVNVTTYSADHARLSMGAAAVQLRMGLVQGVTYLDGGWQTLVDGLRRAVLAAGARIEADIHVEAVLRDPLGGAVRGVRLADGTERAVDAAVIAAGPREARALVERSEETVLPSWEARAIPVRAASLDVALRSLPRPEMNPVFGVDRPLYLSVHSAAAKLAPAGGAVVHVMKYLRSDELSDPHEDERELLGLLDLAQPGWREQLVTRRFLPKLVVSHSLVEAARGGLAGRPGPVVAGVPGLYVAGDWVGPVGMLADGALASAKRAAELIVAETAVRGGLAAIVA
ncbi:MAG: NAD(P)/FAD-dependent oxidoreductase [Thermomicrobiales bacterium]